MIKLLLKRLVGIYSIIAYPGYSGCLRCWQRWKIATPHHTMYSESEGCFPLCKECWRELTPETRLPFYRRLYDKWVSRMTSGLPPFSDIRNAVMKGD